MELTLIKYVSSLKKGVSQEIFPGTAKFHFIFSYENSITESVELSNLIPTYSLTKRWCIWYICSRLCSCYGRKSSLENVLNMTVEDKLPIINVFFFRNERYYNIQKKRNRDPENYIVLTKLQHIIIFIFYY